MPFSSLKDPVDLARAQAALDAAWDEVKSTIPDGSDEQERVRLAYIVAAVVAVAADEEDLSKRAIDRYAPSSRDVGPASLHGPRFSSIRNAPG